MKRASKKEKKENSKKLPKSELIRAKSLENVFSSSKANSKLWEGRLEIAERSRDEYRSTAKRLAAQNDSLSSLIEQNEKDSIDVIKYLKDLLSEKVRLLDLEREQTRTLQKNHRLETEKLTEDFDKKIVFLEEKLKERNHDVSLLKDELKFAHEFRKTRRQMQTEITELKKKMDQANKFHLTEFNQLEKKFVLEKNKLVQESKKKIEELTERTQKEALLKLDETTKSVFKDNIRLKEALNMETKESSNMKKKHEELLEENRLLKEEKQVYELALKKYTSKSGQDDREVTTYKAKVEVLEKSLTQIVHEFDVEKKNMEKHSQSESLSITEELERLRRLLELKSREMAKIKKLAKTILDQRTEVECFFIEALDNVKSEIANETSSLKKSPDEMPMISLEEAEDLNKVRHEKGQIDIRDLTWIQKERVLRLLFAKMNGFARYTKVSLSNPQVQHHKTKAIHKNKSDPKST